MDRSWLGLRSSTQGCWQGRPRIGSRRRVTSNRCARAGNALRSACSARRQNTRPTCRTPGHGWDWVCAFTAACGAGIVAVFGAAIVAACVAGLHGCVQCGLGGCMLAVCASARVRDVRVPEDMHLRIELSELRLDLMRADGVANVRLAPPTLARRHQLGARQKVRRGDDRRVVAALLDDSCVHLREEPMEAKSTQVESSQVKSMYPARRPTRAKSSQAKPSQVKACHAREDRLEPSQAKPSHAKSSHATCAKSDSRSSVSTCAGHTHELKSTKPFREASRLSAVEWPSKVCVYLTRVTSAHATCGLGSAEYRATCGLGSAEYRARA
jgi:hypothetical protein